MPSREVPVWKSASRHFPVLVAIFAATFSLTIQAVDLAAMVSDTPRPPPAVSLGSPKGDPSLKFLVQINPLPPHYEQKSPSSTVRKNFAGSIALVGLGSAQVMLILTALSSAEGKIPLGDPIVDKDENLLVNGNFQSKDGRFRSPRWKLASKRTVTGTNAASTLDAVVTREQKMESADPISVDPVGAPLKMMDYSSSDDLVMRSEKRHHSRLLVWRFDQLAVRYALPHLAEVLYSRAASTKTVSRVVICIPTGSNSPSFRAIPKSGAEYFQL